MRWPQIIVLCLYGIDLLVAAYLHKKEIKINIWSRIISASILIFLLWKGGFFK